MREIKFRAWVECQNRYYGPSTLQEMDKSWSYPFSWGVMEQFTGLYDCNGVEIYEGDVVRAPLNKQNYIINHGLYINCDIDNDGETPDSYGWYAYRLDDGSDGVDYGESLHDSDKYFKVIGNVHQHKHLLDGEIDSE